MTDIRIPMTYHLILASSAMATTYESYKVAEIPAPYVGIKRAPCALRLTMIDLICRTSLGVGWNCAYPIWLLQGDIVTLLGISPHTLDCYNVHCIYSTYSFCLRHSSAIFTSASFLSPKLLCCIISVHVPRMQQRLQVCMETLELRKFCITARSLWIYPPLPGHNLAWPAFPDGIFLAMHVLLYVVL